MKMYLDVRVDGDYFKGGASIEIEEAMQFTFEPVNSCDDPFLRPLMGESDLGSYEVQRKLKLREDYADYLAKEISKLIVNEMQKNDTHNGY